MDLVVSLDKGCEMIGIRASVPLVEAPAWAVMERWLFEVMEDAVGPFLEKYTHPDGRLIWREGLHPTRDGADDFYGSFYNGPLLYLLVANPDGRRFWLQSDISRYFYALGGGG